MDKYCRIGRYATIQPVGKSSPTYQLVCSTKTKIAWLLSTKAAHCAAQSCEWNGILFSFVLKLGFGLLLQRSRIRSLLLLPPSPSTHSVLLQFLNGLRLGVRSSLWNSLLHATTTTTTTRTFQSNSMDFVYTGLTTCMSWRHEGCCGCGGSDDEVV